MSFNLEYPNQALLFFERQKHSMYSEIVNWGQQSQWTCLLALPTVIVSLSIDTIKLVAFIGESVIKGLTHFFGAPFSQKCDAGRGLFFIAAWIPSVIMFAAESLMKAPLVFFKVLVEPKNLLTPFTISLAPHTV